MAEVFNRKGPHSNKIHARLYCIQGVQWHPLQWSSWVATSFKYFPGRRSHAYGTLAPPGWSMSIPTIRPIMFCVEEPCWTPPTFQDQTSVLYKAGQVSADWLGHSSCHVWKYKNRFHNLLLIQLLCTSVHDCTRLYTSTGASLASDDSTQPLKYLRVGCCCCCCCCCSLIAACWPRSSALQSEIGKKTCIIQL